MKNLLLAATLLASTAAAADPLEVKVFTAAPTGFLVTSTIVSGSKDAVLIDAQFDLADAHRLVAELLESRKNLTTIYITHAHPDHYFGLGVIHDAFPKAKIVALPATVAEIKKTWQAKVKYWEPMYGALVPQKVPVPTALAGTSIDLEGQTLEIHGGLQGDKHDSTYVWIPSAKTVVAGDTVFRNIHVWTADSTAADRTAWTKTLDEIAALKPTQVIAGHKDAKADNAPAGIEQTRQYLKDFDAAVASSKTAADAEAKVKAKYKDLPLDVILHIGAGAQYPAAK